MWLFLTPVVYPASLVGASPDEGPVEATLVDPAQPRRKRRRARTPVVGTDHTG